MLKSSRRQGGFLCNPRFGPGCQLSVQSGCGGDGGQFPRLADAGAARGAGRPPGLAPPHPHRRRHPRHRPRQPRHHHRNCPQKGN